MRRNPILTTAAAVALVTGIAASTPLVAAQAADGSTSGQPAGSAAPPNGAGAAEQNRAGGQFSPGGVPTKNEATSEPSTPPNGVGAAQTKPRGSDLGGPGGAPTTGQAATTPSSPGRGGTAPGNETRE